MEFAIVCIGMIVVLGVVAAVANKFDKGKDDVKQGHDCSTCTEAEEGNCKIHCLLEEVERGRKKKIKEDRRQMTSETKLMSSIFLCLLLTFSIFLTLSCSTHKNNAKSRWWHAFNARYNTYFNGQRRKFSYKQHRDSQHQS